MIYTNLTKEAMMIAYNAHHGQVDRGGDPYIFHPFHVAEQMEDEYSACVALLHDVCEDTSVTIDDLRQIFPKEVCDALALLTRDFNENYFDYVKRIKTNEIAAKVKLADITHNMDLSRITNEEQKKEMTILSKRYERARKILLGEEEAED